MGKTHQHPVNILLCHEPRFEFHVLHSFIPRTDFSQQKSLVFTLRQGLIKLTLSDLYGISSPRSLVSVSALNLKVSRFEL